MRANSKAMIMKPSLDSLRVGTILLLSALLSHALIGQAAEPSNTAAPSKKPATAPTTTNTVVEIPQSVFLVSSRTQELRDPFFPKSTRLGPVATATRTNVAGPVVVDLALQGLSGTVAKPLATINNRIFEAGEENDVITPAGRVRVRCVEINLKDETAVVEVGGARRQLRFSRR